MRTAPVPRWARLAVATTAALAVVGGCAAPTPAPGPVAATEAAAPRTVTDATGTAVQVPATAERVIALGENELDMLVALGVQPAGASAARGTKGVARYLAEKAGEVPLVGTVAEANVEAVAAQRPDLVLVGATTAVARDAAQLAKLRGVAPTFVTSKPGEDWKAVLTRVADAVGTPAAVDAVVAADADRVKKVAGTLGATPGTASIVRWNGDGPVYMLSDNAAVRVLGDLGFTRPPAQDQPGPSHSEPLSPEKLGLLDADWVFVGSLNPDGEAALAAARTSPTFGSLGAVARDRVVPIDGSLWTTGTNGPVARAAILDAVAATAAP